MIVAGIVIWGLNIWDLAVILLFLLAVLIVGFAVSHTVKKESDFYLGGRKLGRLLQFFLNFGNSTDSTGAVQISTAVYKQGAGGIWIGFQTLFITPFFWFTQPWWRRARLITMGDLFIDRFNSNSLASAYAAFSIFIALFTMGMGNFLTYKVAHAMIIKPPNEYTDTDRQQIQDYQEYQSLKSQIELGQTSLTQSERFQILDNQNKHGQLQSFISYVHPLPFYIAYSTIVGIYIVLGGLRAAAVTDAVQGLLILVMSILLIPIGLHRIGGFHALHQIVPEYLFTVTSENTWYAIAAITFASLVQIIGLLHNMSTAGSATNEDTARFGMISGGFTKRLVLIAWMFCGLIAIAVLHGKLKLADADNTWGALSHELLVPGLMGLMLSGMLLGHMPSVGVYAVAIAGLTTRNLYEPLVKNRPESHYLRVGQWAIALILIISILFALAMSNVIAAYTTMVTFNTFFGAAIFLLLFWRRLTAASIMISLIIWIIVIGLIPFALPYAPGFRQLPSLLRETSQYTTKITIGATAEDVAANTAQRVGQAIQKPHVVLPSAVFFDQVARSNPNDPQSPREGIGRFNVENYCLSLLHIPVQQFTSPDMVTARWGFDGLFPFFILIVLSFLTKPDELLRADRFFAKMRTPVAPTPEEDKQEVQRSFENPDRFDQKKILPRSNWQFAKWSTQDFLGFFGCWLIVAAILTVLWGVLKLGS
jgi:SSS family solute:Na+ symporter